MPCSRANRLWVAALGLSLLLPLTATNAATVSVLYKRESASSVPRLDTGVQASLAALEEKLIGDEHAVVQAPPEVYAQLDASTGSIVAFSPDAGYALLVDAVNSSHDYQGTEMEFAEVRLRVKLFLGNRVLANLNSVGQVAYRGTGRERAQEAAGRKAVASLYPKLRPRLGQMPEESSGAAGRMDATVTPAVPGAFAPPPPRGETGALPSVVMPATTVAQAAAEPLPPVAEKRALLIGVADFAHFNQINLPPSGKPIAGDLPGVKNDIQLMRKTLGQAGFKKEHVVSLLDGEATTERVRAELLALKSAAGRDDLVLVYVSSHGMIGPGDYSQFGMPILYDTRLKAPDSLRFDEMKTAIKSLSASRVIWAIDTCHSGDALRLEPAVEMSSKEIRLVEQGRVPVNPQLAHVGVERDWAIIVSSLREQVSWIDPVSKYSFFTKLFAAGIEQSQGKETIYSIYKSNLEAELPQAVRKQFCPGSQSCDKTQQPGFSASLRGREITP